MRKTTRNALSGLASVALATMTTVGRAAPIDLIVNGSFSAGLVGWTTAATNLPGTDGGFFVIAAGALTPVNGFETATNPPGGTSFAVTDSNGPGARALYQLFTASAGSGRYTLSFDLFANDQSGFGAPGTTLFGEQYARVDLLRPTAAAFSTSPSDIVATFYNDVDSGTSPNPFQRYSFDVTSFITPGQSYLLRFAEVDSNGAPVNLGVDNVSVSLVVPIPATGWLVAAGLLASAGWRRRRTAG